MNAFLRNASAVLLAATAVATVTAGVSSFRNPLYVDVALTDRHILALHFHRGLARAFWIEAVDRAIRVDHAPQFPRLFISVQHPETLPVPDWASSRGMLTEHYRPILIASPTNSVVWFSVEL